MVTKTRYSDFLLECVAQVLDVLKSHQIAFVLDVNVRKFRCERSYPALGQKRRFNHRGWWFR